jgi:hypothetical protein
MNDGVGRRVSGESKCLLARVADMIRPDRVVAFDAAVLRGRIHAHHDIRLASDGAHLSNQHRRAEHLGPASLLESGTEIGDLYAPTLRIMEPSYEYRRIFEISLLGFDGSDQFDAEMPWLIWPVVSIEQGAKHRIPVEARETAPDHACVRVDQRRDGTVTNHSKIQRRHPRSPL